MTSEPRSTREIGQRRQVHALSLKLAGLTFQQIAESPDPLDPSRRLYASRGAAHNAVQGALARLRRDTLGAGDQRSIEEARYEALLRAVWPKALRGEVPAVQAAARILGDLRAARLTSAGALASGALHQQQPEGSRLDELSRRRAGRGAATSDPGGTAGV